MTKRYGSSYYAVKIVFLYEFIDRLEKLNYAKGLKREDFYITYNCEDITEEHFRYNL